MSNFLSHGGLVENEAFLGQAQKSGQIRLESSGSILVCSIGWRGYLIYFLAGLVFGPGLTFLMIARPPLLLPLVVRAGVFLMSALSWLILLRSVMARRWVTFDFARGRITFSSRFFFGWEHVVEMKSVQQFITSSVVREIADRHSPSHANMVSCYRFGLATKDGRAIYVLETTRQDLVEQIVQIVSKQTHQQIEVAVVSDQIDPLLLMRHPKLTLADVKPSGGRTRWRPLVAFCIAGVGLAMAVINGDAIRRSSAAQGWPTTNATLVQLGLGEPSAEQSFVYQYRVGDKEYQSKRVSFQQHGGAKLPAAYPAGDNVRVWYDPADPAQAVLDPTVDNNTRVWFGLGLAVIAAYALLMWRVHGSEKWTAKRAPAPNVQGEMEVSQTTK